MTFLSLTRVQGPVLGKKYFRMNQVGGLGCCAVCNEETYERCVHCLVVYYCNSDHQRQDWKRHKRECAPKIVVSNNSGERTIASEECKKKVKDVTSNIKEDTEKDIPKEGSDIKHRKSKTKNVRKRKEGGSTDSVSNSSERTIVSEKSEKKGKDITSNIKKDTEKNIPQESSDIKHRKSKSKNVKTTKEGGSKDSVSNSGEPTVVSKESKTKVKDVTSNIKQHTEKNIPEEDSVIKHSKHKSKNVKKSIDGVSTDSVSNSGEPTIVSEESKKKVKDVNTNIKEDTEKNIPQEGSVIKHRKRKTKNAKKNKEGVSTDSVSNSGEPTIVIEESKKKDITANIIEGTEKNIPEESSNIKHSKRKAKKVRKSKKEGSTDSVGNSGEQTIVTEESKKEVKDVTSNIKEDTAKSIPEQGSDIKHRKRKTKNFRKSKEGVSTDSVSKHNSLVSTENVKQSNDTSSNGSGNNNNESSVISSVVYTNQDLATSSAITYEGSSEQEVLRASAQQLGPVEFPTPGTSNVLRTVERSDSAKMPVLPNYGPDQGTKVKEYPEASLKGSNAPFNQMGNINFMDPNDPCYRVCQRVIRDMTQYGVCVLDNFFGKERGLLVLQEVLEMYRSGIFTRGQLVASPAKREVQTIRSDLITWIDGKETKCYYLKQLINQVDNIVLRANRMSNNGKLGDYVINGRTKAMVACYPGSGSHYVKHVDNPNKDGRCITAIYYLNLNWDVKRCGGLLRVFPEGTNQVADIAPIFDRMLFFWSDRRNPHEVQPSYDTRYAVTLWYFDAHEREVALKNYTDHSEPSTSK